MKTNLINVEMMHNKTSHQTTKNNNSQQTIKAVSRSEMDQGKRK
jgi:hypothetical protein